VVHYIPLDVDAEFLFRRKMFADDARERERERDRAGQEAFMKGYTRLARNSIFTAASYFAIPPPFIYRFIANEPLVREFSSLMPTLLSTGTRRGSIRLNVRLNLNVR